MEFKIRKNNGKLEEFNIDKIKQAIQSAAKAIKQDIPEATVSRIANDVKNTFEEQKDVSVVKVEQISELVEEKLMGSNYKDTARCYIRYRYDKDKERMYNSDIIKQFKKKLEGINIENQNANQDEHSFSGRMNEAARILLKDYALNELVSKKTRDNHNNNEIYIHDLDNYAMGTHNCLSIPMDSLLENGYTTRNGDSRRPHSIDAAIQLIVGIMQIQSIEQFGGVSATHLDWTMVPFIRHSFYKFYRDGLKFICKEEIKKLNEEQIENTSIEDKDFYSNPKAREYALELTDRELHQGFESFYHECNQLGVRSGGQLPFSSINYGTCTLKEGQMCINAILDACMDGMGKIHKTYIFPCGIWQYMQGVNDKPSTPNYELFRKALKSTSLRIYPNYVNCNWSTDLAGRQRDRKFKRDIIASLNENDYNKLVEALKKNPKIAYKLSMEIEKGKIIVKDEPLSTEISSTMGALAGNEHLYIKIKDKAYDISIKDFFNYCKTGVLENARPCQLWFNKEISDNHVNSNRKVQTKTGERPEGGVYAITYKPEDVTYIGSTSNICRRLAEHKTAIKLCGKLDAGPIFGDNNLDNFKFEVLEYTENFEEAEVKYIETIPNINVKGATKGFYKNKHTTKSPIYKRPNFKQDQTIPQDLINIEDKDIKVLDRGNKWVKVKHIFKNDKHNTPLMMHIIYNEKGRQYELSCTEDHPLWTGKKFTRADELTKKDKLYRADGLALDIVDISWHWQPCDSYDIGTATGSFIGSDIIMHNCRTYNGYDKNAEISIKNNIDALIKGKPLYDDVFSGIIKDGRGNICPTTIILPTLAMEADKDVEKFMKLLEQKINEAKDSLIERFEYIASQSPKSATFMYGNKSMGGYVPEEGIRSALRHGTLVIGQLGLAECLNILLGCDHTTAIGMELAKRIETLYKTLCAKFKEETNYNFGVYYTPSESLCYTAMKKFKDKYGELKGISDHEYFTNSMHVPVWKDITPFEKIDIEAQLTGYHSAGCITYVELDSKVSKNIDAIEKLVTYAMEKDIPYFAINIPIDTCLNPSCGYSGEFNGKCPKCGGTDIEHLARVTGYLSCSVEHMNKGKQSEVHDRVRHQGNIDC